jgi:hypothetical protein
MELLVDTVLGRRPKSVVAVLGIGEQPDRSRLVCHEAPEDHFVRLVAASLSSCSWIKAS